MARLRVDLQAGFSDDDVVVRLDGRELTSRRDVTTDYAVGLAAFDEFDDVDQGGHELEVSVPTRSLTGSRVVNVTDETHVAVSTDGHTVSITAQTEPFTYF